jgi:Siphovirus Gp157
MILAPARERIREQIDRLYITHPDVMADEEMAELAKITETELPELMNRIIKRMLDAELMAEDQATLMKELKARRDRYVKREEAMRALAFNIMQEEGIRKLELTQRTLSIRLGPTKVIVTDEAALPIDCWRIKSTPNLTAIKEHIAAGNPVPGATLSNAEPVLMVTK